jgi:hypothetical protein
MSSDSERVSGAGASALAASAGGTKASSKRTAVAMAQGYLFSGARTFLSAATCELRGGLGKCRALDKADVAADRNVRAPLNSYFWIDSQGRFVA